MMDGFRLGGKTSVVTGALGKLGPIWARALLEAGSKVFAIDLPDVAVPDSFRELEKTHGDNLHLFRGDILDRESLKAARETCEKHLGAPDVLVNNAGIDQPPAKVTTTYRIEDFPREILEKVLSVNLVGLFLVAQEFGRGMCSRRKGSIINLGSVYAGLSPNPAMYDHIKCDPPFLKPPAYGASKAGVVNLTKYLAAHWGPYGVRVNVLSPGGVLGDQDEEFKKKFSLRVPMGRMAVAADLEGPMVFLASDASSYITGTELLVDGGYTAW